MTTGGRASKRGELRIYLGSAPGGRKTFAMVDHGPGLPKGVAEKVLAPFERLGHHGDRGDSGGTGVALGLSVTQGFTHAMGGTIRAEDTPVAA